MNFFRTVQEYHLFLVTCYINLWICLIVCSTNTVVWNRSTLPLIKKAPDFWVYLSSCVVNKRLKKRKSVFSLQSTLNNSYILWSFVDLKVSSKLWIKRLVLIFKSLTYQNLQSYLSNHFVMIVTFWKDTFFADYNSHLYLVF